MSKIEILRQNASVAPETPGVYLHRDAAGGVLYIGKARNLRARLRSYFLGVERQDRKTRALVQKIDRFETIVVDTETEALVLENNLIKHHRPPFNILLRDDKTYPYLRIDSQDQWPMINEVRRRRADGALYFGPYTDGALLFHLKTLIRRFFPLRKCSNAVFRRSRRPCSYHSVGQCLAPCVGNVEPAVYQRQVDAVIALLEGKTRKVIGMIRAEMEHASAQLQFERAAQFRDLLTAIQRLSDQEQSVAFSPNLSVDLFGVAQTLERIVFFVSRVRDGCLIGGESFLVLRGPSDPGFAEVDDSNPTEWKQLAEANILLSFMCQYYQRSTNDLPGYILLSEGVSFTESKLGNSLVSFLTSRLQAGEHVPEIVCNVKSLRRRRDSSSVDLRKDLDGLLALVGQADRNARQRLDDELRMNEAAGAGVRALQERLGLDHLPERIECYDISTFQGAESVGAQVVFVGGRPAKSQYRLYNVREVLRSDDFAALREVFLRRFREDRRDVLPDVLIVDGGEPQVREIAWVLKNLGLEMTPLVGLAKARVEGRFSDKDLSFSEERLVLPARDSLGKLLPGAPVSTQSLTKGTAEFRLLTHIRDETHRFAIMAHRRRRDRVSRTSVLHRIAGLGPRRRKKLLDIFPDIRVTAELNPDEVAAKTGLPRSVAEAVVRAAMDICTNGK